MWWRLVFKEILRRKWGFLFSVLAVALAVGAWAAVESIAVSLEDEARRITAGMEQNLLIVPGNVPDDKFYRGDFGDEYLPEWILDAVLDHDTVVLVDTRRQVDRPGPPIRFVDARTAAQEAGKPASKRIYQYRLPQLADHYLAELQSDMQAEAGGRQMQVVVTGQRREEGRRPEESAKRKTPIRMPPPAGSAFVGAGVARQLGVSAGDSIRLGPRSFKVQRVEPEQATWDDIRVYLALSDAQDVLGKPGKINRVAALSCICEGLTTAQLADVLDLHIKQWSQRHKEPVSVRVSLMTRIAAARHDLRRSVRSVTVVLMPVLGVICAALVAGYFFFNVRERQEEMGILLAIGYTPVPILGAILFKLALVSLIGGSLGAAGGIYLTKMLAGLQSLSVHKVIEPWYLWPVAMGGAVVMTLLAGIYPLIVAARTEAAQILRNA